MTKFTVTTTSGETVTRSSDAAYVAASENSDGRVRFHKSHAAAKRAAGPWGTVHEIGAAGGGRVWPEIECCKCGTRFSSLRCSGCGY